MCYTKTSIYNNKYMITVIDFFAEWCGPCQAMKPVFDNVKIKLADKVIFKKTDVDEEKELASKYEIRSIPTLVIEEDGKELGRKSGFMNEMELSAFINQYIK